MNEYTDAELAALPWQIPRVAWTGGSSPPRWRDMPRGMRSLVREAFREQLRDSIAYWGDGAGLAGPGRTLETARIYWGRAKGDAHASVRAAVRAARAAREAT